MCIRIARVATRAHALTEGREGQGWAFTVEVRENVVALGRMVKAGNVGGVGRDPTSPGAVGCDKHEESHAEQRPARVVITGPHGAWAQECECLEVHRSRITDFYSHAISFFLGARALGSESAERTAGGGGDVTGTRG